MNFRRGGGMGRETGEEGGGKELKEVFLRNGLKACLSSKVGLSLVLE